MNKYKLLYGITWGIVLIIVALFWAPVVSEFPDKMRDAGWRAYAREKNCVEVGNIVNQTDSLTVYKCNERIVAR